MSRTLCVTAAVLLYACGGGSNARTGQSSLVTISDATLEQCPGGGKQIDSGLDQNQNGVLDPSEVTSSWPVCAGAEGLLGAAGDEVLIDARPMEPNETCIHGGVRVIVAADADGDGVLDELEASAGTIQELCTDLAAAFSGLVFIAHGPGMNELFRVNRDGSGVRRLAAAASTTRTIDSFILSPDRRKLAFVARMDDSNPQDLYVTSLVRDERPVNVSRLSSTSHSIGDAVWSPDGRYLAYIASEGALSRAYAVMADGTGRRLVSPDANSAGSPRNLAWSRDSEWLAFDCNSREEGATYERSVYVVHRTSDTAFRVDDLSGAGGASLGVAPWSQDSEGPRLSFIVKQGTGEDDSLCVARTRPGSAECWPANGNITVNPRWQPGGGSVVAFVESSAVVMLDTAAPESAARLPIPAPVYELLWSPDGAYLAYTYNELVLEIGRELRRLRVAPALGAEAIEVYEDIHFYNNDLWSATGEHLYYYAKPPNQDAVELYTFTTATAASTLVYSGVAAEQSVVTAAWSPDGVFLGFTVRDLDNHCADTLYVKALAGGDPTSFPTEIGVCVSSFAWSQDAAVLAYAGAVGISGRKLLYLTPVDGGESRQVVPTGYVLSTEYYLGW